MATAPYTRQPLADLWDVKVYMLNLFRERYSRYALESTESNYPIPLDLLIEIAIFKRAF